MADNMDTDTTSVGVSEPMSRSASRPELLDIPINRTPPVSVPVSRRSSSVNELTSGFVVGQPPPSPSPLAIRASHSPSSKTRKGFAEPPVNLRQVEYVSQVNDNLVCSICHCPFEEPQRLVDCDHVFCKECLRFAFAHSGSDKQCPACRTKLRHESEPLPRLINTMLDELVIKCPHRERGCRWESKRAEAQDHIELYCEYTLVDCPDNNCELKVMYKDSDKGCLHQTVVCQLCHTSMLKMDLERHEQEICPNRFVACPHCSIDIFRCDLPRHIEDECAHVTAACSGNSCGCTFVCERANIDDHVKTCPMAIMAPTILAQKARDDEQDRAVKLLQRRLQVVEGDLSAVQAILFPSNPTPAATTQTADVSANTPGQTNEQAFNPLEPQMQQFLGSIDNFRNELNHTANNINELEGRMQMMHINEVHTRREEMAHVNSAINTMRMQLHWLISNARSPYARAAAGGATQAPTAASSAPTGSGVGHVNNVGLQPIRRLSDTTRQETKL